MAKESTSGSTTLSIKFVGLCMWARESRNKEREYDHVLFVNHGEVGASDHHGSHSAHERPPGSTTDQHVQPHPKHLPRLVYHKKYERPNFDAHHNGEPVLTCKNLAGKVLYLGSRDEGVLSSGFPSALLTDISEIGGTGPLGRAYVRQNPPAAVASRITLYSGHPNPIDDTNLPRWRNSCDGEKPPKQWEGKLASNVEWVITELEPGPVPLHFLSLSDESLIETLYLRPEDGRITLLAFNSPYDDLPPLDRRGGLYASECERAEHFEAYYSLFPSTPVVLPGLVDEIAVDSPPREFGVTSDCKPNKKASEGEWRTALNALNNVKSFATPANPICTECSCIVAPEEMQALPDDASGQPPATM